MILDTSAIVAILLRQPHEATLQDRITEAHVVAVGAPTLVECMLVLAGRLKMDPRAILDDFLRENRVQVIEFGRDHFDLAADAFYRYGKGRHPAALNYGDCMSYAVARLARLPLLYLGDDFTQTDVNARVKVP